MTRPISLLALASLVALAGCNEARAVSTGAAAPDLIIHGGPILTMAGDTPTYVEAVAVTNGKITAVGTDSDVMKSKDGRWDRHLKLQGMKITQDGSVQGKTASYIEPLLTGGPQGQKNWRGSTTLPYDSFAGLIAKAHAAGVQLFIHANGDGAIQQAIKATAAAGIKAGDDSRTIIIHSQMQHPEDIAKYIAIGLTPSYFTMHTFLRGDVHRKNLGEKQAAFISPMKAAMDAGLKATNHTDFNVTPLDPMMVLWTSMARTTRSGFVLGPDQRIDAYRGLKALTLNAAWEYREETRRGSIEPGKLADFVVLTGDPVKTDLGAIRAIKVVETIKDGKPIYVAGK